ncbi:uncharacterized protein LOC106011316 [Aplysia californica]|uniref:Uncharacterized protein LOC106011316 n=1 Tax=Aplysia californica TaxID=6500 RepID=A0ABM0ZWG6_APLCA|nr:uncharacterized protein LOC106011316 [Aplysia californica]
MAEAAPRRVAGEQDDESSQNMDEILAELKRRLEVHQIEAMAHKQVFNHLQEEVHAILNGEVQIEWSLVEERKADFLNQLSALDVLRNATFDSIRLIGEQLCVLREGSARAIHSTEESDSGMESMDSDSSHSDSEDADEAAERPRPI